MVDDDVVEYRTVKRYLSKIDDPRYTLEWAAKVNNARDMIRDQSFDAIILDYYLGEINGVELAREFFADGLTIPMILLTGMADFRLDKSLIEVGITDYLPKDEQTPQLLERTIRQSIERKMVEAELTQSEERYRELAEQATGVLHNIGNVLNSVKVACQTMQEQRAKTRISQLNRLNEMMLAHRDHDGFLRDHPQGKLIPEYLTRVEKRMQEDQTADLQAIERVLERLALAKEAIKFQQLAARQKVATEAWQLEVLAEESLKVLMAMILKHHIEVETRHHASEPVRVVKPQLVHVIINLIKNAIEAMIPVEGKRNLTIESGQDEEGHAYLEVADTGVGIAPDAFKGLFRFGYSTKQNGHGFGLSYSLKYMEEMGGALTAHSDGVGRGTRFRLRFPRAST